MERRKTRQIKVGKVKIGGNTPISIQSMTKTDTRDVSATVKQIRELEKLGCDIIRVAVKDLEAARAIKSIKRRIRIPLVADIHFHYNLALEAIDAGADKIRLNPGNIRKKEDIAHVVKLAKKHKIPIRIGVNSGSVIKGARRSISSGVMIKAALDCTNIFRFLGFHDIIISVKTSDVTTTIDAYRRIAKQCIYPLHLGVTAAGTYKSGVIKSSVGIGALLAEGIGDTIRVSLTGRPHEEVIAAKEILSSLGLRKSGVEVISCPTCGRCEVDIVKVVNGLTSRLTTNDYRLTTKPLKVAIMGCIVNGPGEAKDADIGIAAGRKSGMLFRKGKVVKKIKEQEFVAALLSEIKKFDNR